MQFYHLKFLVYFLFSLYSMDKINHVNECFLFGLTLFHVTPVANLFVIFKDKDLKFGDNVHF